MLQIAVELAAAQPAGQEELALLMAIALSAAGYGTVHAASYATTMAELERANLIRRRRRFRRLIPVPPPHPSGTEVLCRYYAQARAQAYANHVFALGSSSLGLLIILAASIHALTVGNIGAGSELSLLVGLGIQPITLLFLRMNTEAKRRADNYLDKLRTDVLRSEETKQVEGEIAKLEDPRLRDCLRIAILLDRLGNREIAGVVTQTFLANTPTTATHAPGTEEPFPQQAPAPAE
ncbi:hypothetical protein AB0O82_13780 [Kitasatospora sp. NPDC088264]|uniref:hypothetical protein n=1 Tax=Kitasatospora sp. NPDC088264 TaxID=3155296 RepID=UPI00342FA4BF